MNILAGGDLDFSYENGIAHLHLNRPKKANSITLEMLEATVQTIEDLSSSDELKALVLSAEGKNFSGGVDLKVMDTGHTSSEVLQRYYRLWDEMIEGLEALPIPVIGAIQGPAIAGGLSIALACDLLIGTPSSKFGYPRIPQGYAPGRHNLSHLLQKIGPGRTRLMFLGARIIDGQEAMKWGLLDQLVNEFELETAVQALLDQIKITPKALVTLTNRLVDEPDNEDLWRVAHKESL